MDSITTSAERPSLELVEAARRLGIYYQTCLALITNGTLEARRVGRTWLVFTDSVEKYETAMKLISRRRK